MQVDQRGKGNARRAERHQRADASVQHPGGQSHRHAEIILDMNDHPCSALFAVLPMKSPAVQRMPAVVNLDPLR